MQDDTPTPDRDELVRDANDLLRHAKAYSHYAEIAETNQQAESALWVSHHLKEAAKEITNAMRVADNSEIEL